MSDERELLRRTAELAADFLDTLDERPVFRERLSRSWARHSEDRYLTLQPTPSTSWS